MALASPAPARRRLVAFAWDYAVLCLYLGALLAFGLTLSTSSVGPRLEALLAQPGAMDLVAFATTVLPVWFYFALLEAGPRGATPGKRRGGLRVEAASGGPATLAQALTRNGLKLLPWQLAHLGIVRLAGAESTGPMETRFAMVALVACWALVGWYLLGLTPWLDQRPLYDRMAGTVVVDAPTTRRRGSGRIGDETARPGPS